MLDDTDIELTRRRVLGGIVTIGASGAAAGAGTMALFSDSESSTGNTVQAGTLNLAYGGSGTFTLSTNMAPGDSTSGSVSLVSDGSLTGSLDVDVSYTENDGTDNPTNVTADQLASNLTVTSLTYGGTDVTGQLPASPTLADLANNDQTTGETTGNDLIDLADPGAGTDFAITLQLADVGNDYQGDGLDVTVDFYLNQQDSQ